MALASVTKIHLIANRKHESAVLQALLDAGFVQIENHHHGDLEKQNFNEQITQLEYDIAGIKFAIDFLSGFDLTKKTLVEKINQKITVSFGQLEHTVSHFDYRSVVDQAQDIEEKLNEANNRIEKITTELRDLQDQPEIDFIPNAHDLPRGFVARIVTAKKKNLKRFIGLMRETLPLSTHQELSASSARFAKALIIYQHIDEPTIIDSAKQFDAILSVVAERPISREQETNQLEQQLSQQRAAAEEQKTHAHKLAYALKNLKLTFDYLSWQKQTLLNQQKIGYSWQTFSFVGWIDETLLDPLRERIGKITSDFSIEKLPIDENDSVPVIYKNTWAKPFETVTNIYGAPQSTEPDPTPFLAPFFTLSFGLAITDAGYGIILSIATVAAMYFLKIPKENRKLLWVLFWGGISSIIAGALTGGWFSIDLTKLPAWIGNPLLALQLFNPLEQPLTLFYIALAIGVIQVLFGLLVDTWWKITHRQVAAGILGSGLWIVTLILILLFSGAKGGLILAPYAEQLKWALSSAVIGLVVGKALTSKNIFIGIPAGMLGLYSIVGYFSDVLSYSRLLALGLTTSIIGMVVNIIAQLVFQVPFVGWVLGFITLVGGHIFNLGINALGGFIHSGRLQYIEFFPKFMEGGGRTFQPFWREGRYVTIAQQHN